MRKLLTLIVLGLSGVATAQQLPQFSQHLRNQYLVNPAAAGVYDSVDITMGGRMQWSGFTNAPGTAFLTVTSPLKRTPSPVYNPSLRTSSGPIRNPEIHTGKLKHAVGGQVMLDQYGAFRRMYFGGTYALHIPVAKDYNLSFGTRLGLSNNTFLSDKATPLNAEMDNTYQSFIAGGTSRYIMDIGFGMYFYSKRLYVGIAADDLSRDLISFGSGTPNFNTQIHYNISAGYKFQLNENMTLTPGVIAKIMTPAPLSIEGTVQLEYKEWLWFGLGYRNKEAVIGLVGLNISEKFKLGYSYDYNISRINQVSSGGHELVLGLMLGR